MNQIKDVFDPKHILNEGISYVAEKRNSNEEELAEQATNAKRE